MAAGDAFGELVMKGNVSLLRVMLSEFRSRGLTTITLSVEGLQAVLDELDEERIEYAAERYNEGYDDHA